MEEVDSVLVSFEFASDAIELLTVEVSGDRATSREQLPVDNATYGPPHAQHNLSSVGVRSGRRHPRFTAAEPLPPARMVNVEYPLLVSSNEIAQPLIVPMGSDQVHACVCP